MIDQIGQLHQIAHAEAGTPGTEHPLGIRCGNVGPLRRNAVQLLLADLQQQPRTVAAVALADADELLPAEGMKRMGHPDKVRLGKGTVCILNGGTNAYRAGGLWVGPEGKNRSTRWPRTACVNCSTVC